MSHISWVHGPKPHVHSVWLYWGVFAALVALTVLTLEVAQYDFGELNVVVALLIASTKASLVMAIFMHLAFDNKFFLVIASTSLVFLSLFILFPILDFATRADLDPDQANFLPRDERVYKHELDMPNALPLRPGLEEAKKDELIFIGPHEH
jgi:cytochrome c oxidase subunit 4